MLHPWAARLPTALERLAAGLPAADVAPVAGPALLRDGRPLRAALARLVGRAAATVYAGVLREPARAAASCALYRTFLMRELPAIVAGRYADARLEVPVKLLFPRGDGAQQPSQLPGIGERAPEAEVELVDGNHFLPDRRPGLVAERALAWFA